MLFSLVWSWLEKGDELLAPSGFSSICMRIRWQLFCYAARPLSLKSEDTRLFWLFNFQLAYLNYLILLRKSIEVETEYSGALMTAKSQSHEWLFALLLPYFCLHVLCPRLRGSLLGELPVRSVLLAGRRAAQWPGDQCDCGRGTSGHPLPGTFTPGGSVILLSPVKLSLKVKAKVEKVKKVICQITSYCMTNYWVPGILFLSSLS